MKKTFFYRRKRSINSFYILLVILLVMPFAYSSEASAETNEDRIVLGYYTSWAPPKNLDPNKVTHINYAFADVCWEGIHGNPDNEEIAEGEPKTWACENLQGEIQDSSIPNGTIVLYDSEVDLVELPKLAAMKQANPNLKTLISVGGWTLSNNLSLVARDEDARETFAQSAVEFVRAFDLDGLDLDWEYPVAAGMPNNHRDESDKENHTLLLQAVRDAFIEAEKEDGKEYLVTIAGAANWAYAENNELSKIAEIVDYVAIMAYDINGTWSGLTGHNAPLHSDPLEAEIRGWNFGVDGTLAIYGAVPKDKLVLGLPFYGHSWAGCNVDQDGKMVTENGPYQECAAGWENPGFDGGTVSYDRIKSIVNKDGYKYYFDNVSKAPYLYNDEKGEFISYDNVESLGYKVNFIKENGLAGAMIWDLGTDDADYNLLKTVAYGLGISTEAPEPDPTPEPDPDPEPNPDPDSEPEPDLEPNPDPGVEPDPEPEPNPDPGLEPEPSPDPEPNPTSDPDSNANLEQPDDDNELDDVTLGDENKTEDDKTPIVEKVKNGEKLPETATNFYNVLLIGSILLLAGIGLYVFQSRRIVKNG